MAHRQLQRGIEVGDNRELLWCGRQTGMRDDHIANIAELHRVELPSEITHIRCVGPGHDHVLLVDGEGKCWSWGHSENTLKGHPPSVSSPVGLVLPIERLEGLNIIDCSAGLSNSMFLTDEYEIYGMTYGIETRKLALPEGMQGRPIRVECGLSEFFALTEHGEVVMWTSQTMIGLQLPFSSPLVDIVLSSIVGGLTAEGKLETHDWNSRRREKLPMGVLAEYSNGITQIASKGSKIVARTTSRCNWSIDTHHRCDKDFKGIVQTLLLICRRDKRTGHAAYPQSHICELPKELLYHIISYLSPLSGSVATFNLQTFSLPTKVSYDVDKYGYATDIASGWDFSAMLTSKGQVLTWWERNSYGEAGHPVSVSANEIPTEPASLSNRLTHKIWAGYFYLITLTDREKH